MYLPILLSLVFSVTTVAARQQGLESSPTEIYQQIPKEQRESLRQAVEKVIIAQKERDWKTVWLLYDKRQDEILQPYDKRKDETEGRFLKEMNRSWRLRNFKPVRISLYPPDNYWNIEGCASRAGDPEGKGVWAGLHARWADNRWYLSTILIELIKEPGPGGKVTGLRECSAS
jgi:hypothetical protein